MQKEAASQTRDTRPLQRLILLSEKFCRRTFPRHYLTRTDYIVSSTVILSCFFLFCHEDIQTTGRHSLQLFFGQPSEFYENCKNAHQVFPCVYPPSIYVSFALWLSPFKLLGFIKDTTAFPLYLSYWLKLLTTIIFAASAWVSYKIALLFSPSRDWAKYAAAAWVTAPLAVFSQFIFSQYDIFHVLLALCGILFFLREKPLLASVCFGLAVTFKPFSAFVFLPLLLLYEKRLLLIAFYGAVFVLPTAVMNYIFRNSPAFIESVRNFSVINRIYAATLDMSDLGFGFWRYYLLITATALICGYAYFVEVAPQRRPYIAAYVWLTSTIAPYLFILWYPHWLIFLAAPIALTSALDSRTEKFMILDLLGMFLFVCIISISFEGDVDALMFKGELFGIKFDDAYSMAALFNWFGDHSKNVFLSAFCAYLILQITLKFRPLVLERLTLSADRINYSLIRQRLYVGILMFALPASVSLFRTMSEHQSLLTESLAEPTLLLKGATVSFNLTAKGATIKKAALLIYGNLPSSGDDLTMTLVNDKGDTLSTIQQHIKTPKEFGWSNISLPQTHLDTFGKYKLSITSAQGLPGNSLSILAARFWFPTTKP